MLAPKYLSLECAVRGDTLTFSEIEIAEDDAPLTFAEYNVAMTFRRVGAADSQATLAPGAGLTETGDARFLIGPIDTAAWTAGRYEYDLQYTHVETGGVRTFLRGHLTLMPDVTP